VKIFISWSGEKSRHVAEALRTWLPTVLAGTVECFVSSQDIRRGERGMDVIAGELLDRDFGIVVLTKDNMSSPWINFEAGALGKSLGIGKVAPVLLDVTRADVEGPISQFQNSLLTDRDDMRQFIRDLAAMNPGVPDESVDALFSVKWPELETVIDRAAGMDSPTTSRSTESMLEEVLEHVRSLRRLGSPFVLDEQNEMKRRNRIAHMAIQYGGDVANLDGRSLPVLDYDPRTKEVLLQLGDSSSPTWISVESADLTPF
jgi:TIR domain